jgi:hypothetical protein
MGFEDVVENSALLGVFSTEIVILGAGSPESELSESESGINVITALIIMADRGTFKGNRMPNI